MLGFLLFQQSRYIITFRTLKRASIIIWIFSAIFNLPYFFYSNFTQIPELDISICYVKEWEILFITYKMFQTFSVFIFYITPVFILLFLYVRMTIRIHTRYNKFKTDAEGKGLECNELFYIASK